MPLPSLGNQRHQVSVRPSVCLYISCQHDNSRLHKGNFVKFGEVLTMRWQLTVGILDITEQRSRSPHNQIWAKIQFWSHNSQGSTFCQLKSLIGAVLRFLEIWGPEVNGQGHHMTKYMYIQKYNFGVTTPFKYTREEFLSVKKTSWGNVKHFWNPLVLYCILKQTVNGQKSLMKEHELFLTIVELFANVSEWSVIACECMGLL